MNIRSLEVGLSPLPVLRQEEAPNPARHRRDTLLLDGAWSLSVNGEAPGPVLVPFAPQAKVNGIAVPEGPVRLDYSTAFELPEGWPGAVLHLEGVDHDCEVSLNGVALGSHRGAWDPVEVFVPAEVLALGLPSGGARLHALRVAVRDNSRSRRILSGKQEREAEEGAIFYGNMAGLWKSAWIEKAGPARLGAHALLARASGDLALDVEVPGGAEGMEVSLTLAHPDGGGVSLRGPVRDGRAHLAGRVDSVRAWTTDAPHLYFGTLALLDADGAALDEFATYAGFRDFSMRDGYYWLNERPFYLQGLLNQAIYSDTLYTPTDRHTLTDFEHTRDLGFTGERRHQTTPRHRDLFLADRMGHWLTIELPSGRNLLARPDRDDAIAQWRRIVRAYAWNHPSVLFLVAGNEDWGLLEHHHHRVPATHKDRETFQIALGEATEAVAPPGMPYAVNDGWRCVTSRKHGKALGRLDASRLMFNIHDYADNAKLSKLYGSLPRWPAAGQWGSNPKHCFHPSGYSYDGETPLVLSEIGGRALLDRTSRGVFAYGKIHRDPELWAEELAELLTLMGRMPVVRGGYVLTQTRDAGNDPDDPRSRGEINGVLDAHGLPKYAGPLVREANERARALWAAGLPEARGAAA